MCRIQTKVPQKRPGHLKLGHWNVKGLKAKQDDVDFFNEIKDFDICVLTETWLTKIVEFENFTSFILEASKIPGKRGRFSGGVQILVKKNIRKSIKFEKKMDYGIYVKIDKNVTNLDKNLYVCGIYLPPEESPYEIKDVFENIERDFSDYLTNGYVLAIGDMNARTANLPDFITSSKGDKIVDLLNSDSLIDPDPRYNMDNESNKFGKKLNTLCKKSDMLLLNGRTEGDIPGRCTYYGPNGSSTIDYAFISNDILSNVLYFHVKDVKIDISDHALIQLVFKADIHRESSHNKDNLNPLVQNYIWNNESAEMFKKTLNTEIFSSNISNILQKQYDLTDEGSDDLCKDTSLLYKKAADTCLKMRNLKTKKQSKKKKKFTKLQDHEYNKLKKDLKSLGNLLRLYPKDPFIRGKLFYVKKNFGKLLKREIKAQKEEAMNKIQEMESKNPTLFWKFVNNIKKKKENNEDIDVEVFYDYFKSLHEGINNKSLDKEFRSKLEQLSDQFKGKQWVDILDKDISKNELIEASRKLKNNKACGFDNITNEMIKCSIEIMSTCLIKLFNHILHSEKYPASWSKGYINPIYKRKGDKSEPCNYRGITISSCLGKLFTYIINSRFNEFLLKNKILKNEQIGFIPGNRTSDHIFVLKTLFDFAKMKKTSLYLCFVDFKSAFDTVWREGLLYKLTKINASCKFINLIKSMYSKVESSVKCKHGYTEAFKIGIGARQGCNLSPALFNCYVNDIPRKLDKLQTDQPLIIDRKISCLMYADDLVLISKSAKGLQKMISVLERYCNKWQLTVNVNKTKILIVHQKKGNINNKWLIYNKNIETVESFCYLGIELDKKGNMTKAVNRLSLKATKAYLGIREDFNLYNGTSVKVMIKLFDTMVKPIALYGNEIWSIYGWKYNKYKSIHSYLMSQKHQFEKLHSRFCKQSIGVDKYSPDVLAKAELGRYPIMSDIVQNSFRYWHHLLTLDQNSIAFKALLLNMKMDQSGYNSYYTRIKSLFAVLRAQNMIYPIENRNKVKNDSKLIRAKYNKLYDTEFFTILKGKYQNKESKGKFDIYCKTKRVYKKEKYLFEIENNMLRKHISGIRCASNILPINFLRKRNVKRENRYCKLCNENKIGDELHVIMKCTNKDIKKHRAIFLEKIFKSSPQLKDFKDELILHYLVSVIETQLTIYLAIFLDKVYNTIKHAS